MKTNNHVTEEKKAPHLPGMLMLWVLIIAEIAFTVLFIYCVSQLSIYGEDTVVIIILIISALTAFGLLPVCFIGLKVIKPNEAMVLTLFGRYYGTLQESGFYFVNPFVASVNPCSADQDASSSVLNSMKIKVNSKSVQLNKKISLKAMTLNNDKQKINDAQGNPIIIGIVVIWKVVNTAKAVFNVDNYIEYLSIQTDAALRNIVRLYPYDENDAEGEKSLRGSSLEVAEKLKDAIQEKAGIAGIEILEARITHLSYAPEIAAAMLQRQQASAIIAARSMIVEGAVSMVEMALDELSEKDIVSLDEERKAQMVSNLLVILCGNKDAQPIVNSGSIY
ncbi:MAG: SPFH domain-containing protein [Sphaerochaetaceae bacterium]|nr:SPFH domain-containing protein [Sphaerochaetaceae bacterium]